MSTATRANIVKSKRKNEGLGVVAAAAHLGMSTSTYQRAERGLEPQPRHAKAIADWCGVQVTDLWPIEDEVTAA